MSLAPSPTASASASGSCCAAAASSSAWRLPSAPSDRLADRAAEPAALDQQFVRDRRVEAELGGDAVGEAAEAARDEQAIGAVRAHRPHQRPGAGREADALGVAAVDHLRVEALQQGDAGVERGLEIELAAHRLLGDRCDLGPEAGIIGELVDAFDADHRRIHVGDEQPLAAAPRAGWTTTSTPGTRPSSAGARRPDRRRAGGRRRAPPRPTPRRAIPPSASRAAEISPRASRSFAIRVAMNIAWPFRNRLSRLSRGRPRAASRRSRSLWRSAPTGSSINADSAQVYRDLRIVSARPARGGRGAGAASPLRLSRRRRRLLGGGLGGGRQGGDRRGA